MSLPANSLGCGQADVCAAAPDLIVMLLLEGVGDAWDRHGRH